MSEFRLLTATEVAQKFRITKQALYTQRRRGMAPGNLGLMIGKKLLWSEADLQAWWDREKRRRQVPTPDANATTARGLRVPTQGESQ